ncbi:MAP kinase kinase kinase [Mycena venus]|uniref:MAP kinase kinase kinase n=1 Tax=Mycena venus TaxID=2733690 RepID=A0A8H7CRV1_9AGAR|nr:MAP kinase kinase kinase [Mycena venus]
MSETLTFMPETRTFVPSTSGTMMSTRSGASFDSDSDDCESGMWQKPPTAERPKSILRVGQDHRPSLTVQTNSNGLNKTAQLHATFAPGSTPASQQRPRSPSPSAVPPVPPLKSSSTRKSVRGSTFTAREEDTWAPRPPPEDVD